LALADEREQQVERTVEDVERDPQGPGGAGIRNV
jgi:hypothetical protein